MCVYVDNRKFACDWPDCRRSFLHSENLSTHRRQHTEPKPFRCELCPLAYWQKSSLRSHRIKAHGSTGTVLTPSDSVADSVGVSVVNSCQSLTDVSSVAAVELVDGIIKSVTASLHSSMTMCDVAETRSHSDNVTQSADTLTSSASMTDTLGPPTGSVSPPTTTDVCSVEGEHFTTELANHHVIAEAQHMVSSVADSGVSDVASQPQPAVTSNTLTDDLSENTHTTTPSVEPLSSARPPCDAQLRLNVYEFCEDDTAVNICLPKPSRTSRTSIELTHTTIELNNHHDSSDNEDHDVTVFDDDTTPTVDRLAETVITYSRRRKQPVDKENTLSRSSERDDATDVGKKSNKRKSSVTSRRRKRGGVGVVEVFEEPVKKKVRRRGAAKSNDDEIRRQAAGTRTVNDDDVLTETQRSTGSKLSRRSTASRSTKRSKKQKISVDNHLVNADESGSKTLTADDDVDSSRLVKRRSSAAVGDSKPRRGRRARRSESLSSEQSLQQRDKSLTAGSVEHDAVSQSDVISVGVTVDDDADRTEQVMRPRQVKRGRGRGRRRTRAGKQQKSSHNQAAAAAAAADDDDDADVNEGRGEVCADDGDEAVGDGRAVLTESLSGTQLSVSDAGCHGDDNVVTEADTAAVSNNVDDVFCQHSADDTTGPAAESLSDNTEILSLNDDNTTAADGADGDDDANDNANNIGDDDDDGEFTRRSSPASYKSDECVPRLSFPVQHVTEDSTGNCCLCPVRHCMYSTTCY